MQEKKLLIEGPIQLENYIEFLQTETTHIGGQVIFLGKVRNDVIDGKQVKEIIYSAYPEMVESEVTKIKQVIFEKYSDVKCIIFLHSTGSVKVGEISLFVSIFSGHRKQAFQAIDEMVDLIKASVPVWKKEVFTDNTYHWIQ